jgi:hypothetical protein
VNGLTTATITLLERVADTVELILRKGSHSCPIDSSVLETRTDDELIAVAESLAFLRPLVPYPKWRFDADLVNPDLAFQFRRWLWQYFNDRKREGPIVIPWHCGTRLRLFEHAGHNTLGAFAYQVETQSKDLVEVRRLDEVLNENPLARLDIMKIDVEGAELRLLRGAVETLRKYRPVLLFEVAEASLKHQSGSPEELLALLRAENYLIHTFDRVTGLPVPAAPRVFAENMIGYPSEKPVSASSRWSWPTQSLSR